jgi:DNA-binding transcriptional LysR family regulator
MATSSNLDLNLLRAIVALLEAGTVSAAATKLGVSQPTLSGALARLRTYFGDPLFVRSSKGMVPTPRGTAVGEAARDILGQIDERLQTEVQFEPAREHSPFTFAMSDVGEMVFLPKLLRTLAAASPDTPVRSVSMRPAHLAQSLADGEVDLAIGYFPDLKQGDFFQQRLFTHRFICLLRADHPVQGNRLTLNEFLALEHAVVHSEGRSQEIFESCLQERGLARRVAIFTPHFMTIPKLIAHSDMVVTVPHAVGIIYGKPVHGLKTIQPPFPSPRIELKQHWHRRVHKDARNVWLRHIVSQLFNADTDDWEDDSGQSR